MGNPDRTLHRARYNLFVLCNLCPRSVPRFPPPAPLHFVLVAAQKWREKLERGQPSGPREVHGRRREALEDGRSEAEARWSGDGERPPCQGCLAKEAELAEAIESLELVQWRSRAAVDRSNEQQAELERREEHALELQRALEAKNSEVLRIEVRERGHIHTLRIQIVQCFCAVFSCRLPRMTYSVSCGGRESSLPCTTRSAGYKASGVVLTCLCY